MLSDGGGLYLRSGVWVFRYTSPATAKERDLSLGSASSLSVKDARVTAIRYRSLLAEKKDPRDVVDAERALERAEAAANRAFGELAQQWCDEALAARKTDKNRRAIRSAVLAHAKPLMKVPMTEVTSKMIADAVKPLADRPAQRDQIVSLIHSIFDWAMIADLIPERPNPARRAKLKKLGVSRDPGKQPVRHNTFIPLDALPAFIGKLEDVPGNLARALEFLIHTGLRTVEVIEMRWAYVDLNDRSITIPAGAMKAKQEHRVYLSDRAYELVGGMQPQQRQNGFVFPGGGSSGGIGARSLSTMLCDKFPDLGKVQIHGARASLKTWATAHTHHRREIIELSLAHAIGGAVESAYLRDNDASIRKAREALYRDWSTFLRGGSDNVVQFKPHAA